MAGTAERVARLRGLIEGHDTLVVGPHEPARQLALDDLREDAGHRGASCAGDCSGAGLLSWPACPSPRPTAAHPTRPGSRSSWRSSTTASCAVPNLLSFGRLAAIPVFLWLLFGRDEPAIAAVLLGVLGATDWVDGYVARRLGQVSEMGKLLDPAADRILLITAVVAISVDGATRLWFSVPVMVREPVMFAAVVLLGRAGRRPDRRDVVRQGGNLRAHVRVPAVPPRLRQLRRCRDRHGPRVGLRGLPGLVLSYYAAVQYLPMARRALAAAQHEAAGHVPGDEG
ncbi:MAG: CDP-alcohol phosphatidyltransferase family protein [Acidimicrobiia bacterium]|nr:CDP-alcohol phosphatidyltransferase family protein [Acidimicrobiia bacterium]